jgi:hypothetical protein
MIFENDELTEIKSPLPSRPNGIIPKIDVHKLLNEKLQK